MMRYVGCGYARALLEAFVDGELPMGEQVQVESHLRWCHTCAARVEDLRAISGALRMGARAHQRGDDDNRREPVYASSDDGLSRALAAMQAEVLARVDTEYEQSLAVRAQVAFADLRLLWPALGATAAVALSVVLASGVWKATSADQPTSLAAMIESLADPGSNRNPLRLDGAMYIPRVLDDGVALDGVMLASNAGDGHSEDDVVAVAAVVTREGKIGGFELLDHASGQGRVAFDVRSAGQASGMEGVLHAVRQSRFAPAQSPGGRVVAVNMVWLFARTTVKASSNQLVDLGVPLSRPVLAAPRVVIKPVGATPEGASSQEQTSEPMASTTA